MSQTFSKLPAGKQPNVKKREPLFSLHVTGPRLAAGLIAGVIAIGWIFLLGMVAGQMYPDLLSRETDESAQRAATRDLAQTAAPQDPSNGVIQPEDLEYKQRAGTTTASGASGTAATTGATQSGGAGRTGGMATGSLGSANAPTVAAGQIGGAAAGRTSAAASGQAAGQAAGQGAGQTGGQADGQSAGRTAGSGTSQATSQATAQAADLDQHFSYTYQVASFKTQGQARALADKLIGDGVACQVTQVEANAATWYRVMVNLIGTEADTRNLKNILGKYGISQVIMYTKIPVDR